MNSVTLPNSDASKFCRFCLSEINLLNVIGSSPKAQETHGEILRLAKTYLQLELRPDQDFPSAVCEMCIGLLYDFDKLYKNAQEYSYALRLLLQGQRRKMVNDIESEIPVNTIESVMDMYDPSPILFIDVDNNGYEEQLIVSNVFGGGGGEQITVEDVPIAEQNERQEAQIDVYHVDGQLQHIVMEGGTLIELKTEETPKPPANLQTTHLLNASHSKGATYSAVRKRSAAAPSFNAQQPPVLPKKSVPTKLPSAVMCTPTRTLNVEASGKRRPAQLTGQQHSQSVGGVASKQLYRCNQCSNLFVELSNYYRHTCQKRQTDGTVQNSSSKQSAAASDGQRTQCKLCNMSYRTKLQYQKHEYEAHGIRNENFGIKCTICHKLFSQRQDYQLHMRAIHPMQGVSFVKIHG